LKSASLVVLLNFLVGALSEHGLTS